MCEQEKITRMADGIYVLENKYSELLENLREVFTRARKANLTFKPSKIVICQKETVIFGWKKNGTSWEPTPHTVNPLINADCPKTVKQLRSWIGSYKQLADCLEDYAIPLKSLETLTGSDKNSKMEINWTEEMVNDFENAKKKYQISYQFTFQDQQISSTHTLISQRSIKQWEEEW